MIEKKSRNKPKSDKSDRRTLKEEKKQRDLAVQTVETTFVLAEFTFWKVGQLFYYNLSISSLLSPCPSITFATSWFVC